MKPTHKSYLTGAPRRRPRAGFTLIEVLIILAIISILGLLTMLTFKTYYPRMQLRSTTSQFSQVIQKARLEAIKRGIDTVVGVDTVHRELVAFADIDGRATVADQYLYTPGADSDIRQDDYEIGHVPLPGNDATGVIFASPLDPPGGPWVPVDGLTAIPSDPAATPVLVFSRDGTVEDLGAFRLSDQAGNHFEVRLTTVAGSLRVLKYLKAADAPGGVAGFFREGNESDKAVSKNVWVWY